MPDMFSIAFDADTKYLNTVLSYELRSKTAQAYDKIPKVM